MTTQQKKYGFILFMVIALQQQALGMFCLCKNCFKNKVHPIQQTIQLPLPHQVMPLSPSRKTNSEPKLLKTSIIKNYSDTLTNNKELEQHVHKHNIEHNNLALIAMRNTTKKRLEHTIHNNESNSSSTSSSSPVTPPVTPHNTPRQPLNRVLSQSSNPEPYRVPNRILCDSPRRPNQSSSTTSSDPYDSDDSTSSRDEQRAQEPSYSLFPTLDPRATIIRTTQSEVTIKDLNKESPLLAQKLTQDSLSEKQLKKDPKLTHFLLQIKRSWLDFKNSSTKPTPAHTPTENQHNKK